MDKKLITQETYDKSADLMAVEFNCVGPRIEDIDRAFYFVGKFNPFVLEIGCGNGRDAREILERTNQYIGIDSSYSMIKLARQTAPHGSFIIIDAEDFEFFSLQQIDIVYSFVSLSHFNKEALKNIFQQIYEKLNKGGVIYISLKYGAYREVIKDDEYGKRVFYYYLPEDIKNVAGKKFKTVYENKFTSRGKEWFTLALKK